MMLALTVAAVSALMIDSKTHIDKMQSILLVNYIQEIFDMLLDKLPSQRARVKSKVTDHCKQNYHPFGSVGTGSRPTEKALGEKQQKPTDEHSLDTLCISSKLVIQRHSVSGQNVRVRAETDTGITF